MLLLKLLAHQELLLAESCKHNVFVIIEHHKRFDLAHAGTRHRAKSFGEFNYFYSCMSQPWFHLQTLKAQAGKDNDISRYLNSHYIDICESTVPDWKPVRVTANGSRGIAQELGCTAGTEDTMILLMNWQKRNEPGRVATGVYTTS